MADQAITVDRFLIPVDVPRSLASHVAVDSIERIAALVLVLLATGLTEEEVVRRLHGWRPRQEYGQ